MDDVVTGFIWILLIALLSIVGLLTLLVGCNAWNHKSPNANSRPAKAFYPVLKKLAKKGNPIHVSHRGGSYVAPANTMYAYKLAVEVFKTDVLEVDLHLSKDGHIVLMHDRTVETTTNGRGHVSTFSLDQLKRLDAGYWFSKDGGLTFPFRDQGLVVPTLVEVLDAFADSRPDLVFFLDFKAEAAVNPAMKLIAERNLMHRVVVGAVPPAVNKALLRARPPDVPITVDFTTMISLTLLYFVGLDWLHPLPHDIVGFIVTKHTRRLLSKSIFQAFRRRGVVLALFGPAVNNEQDQRTFIEWGVDMMVTDRPDLLNRVMGRDKKESEGGIGAANDSYQLPSPAEFLHQLPPAVGESSQDMFLDD